MRLLAICGQCGGWSGASDDCSLRDPATVGLIRAHLQSGCRLLVVPNDGLRALAPCACVALPPGGLSTWQPYPVGDGDWWFWGRAGDDPHDCMHHVTIRRGHCWMAERPMQGGFDGVWLPAETPAPPPWREQPGAVEIYELLGVAEDGVQPGDD